MSEQQQDEGTHIEEQKTEEVRTEKGVAEKTTTTRRNGGEPRTTHTATTTHSDERESGG